MVGNDGIVLPNLKKDYKIMTQVIFPQTLGKALWAQFTDRHFSVQAENGKTC